MVSQWLDRPLNLKDIARLYVEKSGEWLLLEILETDARENPRKLRLLAHHPSRDKLHEFIMEDDHWDWQRRYLIVRADPDKPCTI